jgi:hypothetical protein
MKANAADDLHVIWAKTNGTSSNFSHQGKSFYQQLLERRPGADFSPQILSMISKFWLAAALEIFRPIIHCAKPGLVSAEIIAHRAARELADELFKSMSGSHCSNYGTLAESIVIDI